MAARAQVDQAYLIVSSAVDQAFYIATNPDLEADGLDPVRHYLERGWREGRDPAPWFSAAGYLERNPDVAASGQEPLTHYLLHGQREGRAIVASSRADDYRRAGGGAWRFEPRLLTPPEEAEPEAPAEPAAPYSPEERAIVETEFDRAFYLDTNPDLAEAGCDPVEHFMIHGWREGRDPSALFCVRDYLHDNPDVADAGINPFLHYIVAGRAEGRAPRNTLGFRYQIIAGLTSLEDRVAAVEDRAARATADDEGLSSALDRLARNGLSDLHLTFSHDDYTANVGGVQLCLQYESAEMARRGRDHLHLCPATPWPVLRRGQPALLTVILNGERVGTASAATVAEALAARRESGMRGSFALHNLLGHDVDEVLAVLDAAGLERGFYWLHDFTSLCAGYQLLRNDVQDCGAPPLDSAACGVCLYKPGRAPQIAEHERLFASLSLTVVSPSQTTLDFWRGSSAYRAAGAVVHPHVTLRPRRGPAAPEPQAGPLRLAFLGMPAAHKGWPVFAKLAADFAGDPRYRFLHLGARRDPRALVEFHPVSVSLSDPGAMQRAIEALEVDVAVIWSIFRETYCLAAHEAVAGGAALVTCPDSANVAAYVEGGAPGVVLPDEAALGLALREGALMPLARRLRRPQLFDLAYSAMTADLIAPEVAA